MRDQLHQTIKTKTDPKAQHDFKQTAAAASASLFFFPPPDLRMMLYWAEGTNRPVIQVVHLLLVFMRLRFFSRQRTLGYGTTCIYV